MRQTALFSLAILLMALLLAGCATNGYNKYYAGSSSGALTNLPPWSGETQLCQSSNPQKETAEILRKNYSLIGTSLFEGADSATRNMLISQAKKVGADLVLYNSQYTGTTQAVMHYPQFVAGQTYVTPSGGTYTFAGAGGAPSFATATYHATATPTIPGTYISQTRPITLKYYKHEAIYFRKSRPPILGIRVEKLAQETKDHLQRETGLLITIVVNDSPAMRAQIHEGDIIAKIAGEDLSLANYDTVLKKYAGQEVDIELIQNGESKKIAVPLNTGENPQPPNK